jgi:predicted lipoprotein with Yx(FWY)xxD motif
MTNRRRHPIHAVALFALTLAVVACGDDGEADAPAAEAGDEAAAVVTVNDTALGEVLADAGGRTLYVFTNDVDGTSACVDSCAEAWPPLTVDEGFAVADGLDAADFATTTRADGRLQLTVADQPLYLFASDVAAGDTSGQGVGEVWFVVDPSGAMITDRPGSSAPADDGNRGDTGY